MGKPEGTRSEGRSRHRWKDNIKIDLGGIVQNAMDCLHVTQDRDQWKTVADGVTIFPVP
jgi:hypothetical protein